MNPHLLGALPQAVKIAALRAWETTWIRIRVDREMTDGRATHPSVIPAQAGIQKTNTIRAGFPPARE